ncbi:MAG: hypothetical protein K9I82_15350 [Chitinophagaceae bacterium]|nr:hypothetical protein [Chitinophagaceae bacterium]
MARILFEYKDEPIIIKHNYEKILLTKFISIFKKYGKIEQKEHYNLDELIEQKSKDDSLVLRFISIQGQYDDGSVENIIYEVLPENDDSEIVFSEPNTSNIDDWLITFSDDSFDFDLKGKFNYKRILSLNRINDGEFDETFYEIIPPFHDVLFELYFITEVIINKINNINIDKIEAYLMQAKLKYDK